MLVAHPAHWAIYVLYAVPIVVVLGSVAVSLRRERRAQRAEVNRSPET
jgi:cytochrome c-type biogenesis protein CcmH/NrfF